MCGNRFLDGGGNRLSPRWCGRQLYMSSNLPRKESEEGRRVVYLTEKTHGKKKTKLQMEDGRMMQESVG